MRSGLDDALAIVIVFIFALAVDPVDLAAITLAPHLHYLHCLLALLAVCLHALRGHLLFIIVDGH